MRAVRFDRYGGTEVLYVTDVERPEPGEGELLIKVIAAGANLFDTKVREGMMEAMIKITFPTGQGSDLAGVVEAVGPGVSDFAVGDEIIGGSAARGSHAEYALVKAARVVRRPAAIEWDVAGGMTTVCETAYSMLAAVQVSGTDTVLVSGAAGGVGSIVTQIAVARGATVIGVASQANHEWLKAHGAIPVSYDGDLKRSITDAAPQGIDAVLDSHGGGYIELGLELGVAPERIDTIADQAGAAKHPGVKTDGGMVAPKPQALQELTDLVVAGELQIRVERVFALDEVKAAYELLERGHPQGKVILRP